jgi:hypothetical protein
MEKVSDTQYLNNARLSRPLPTLEEVLNQTAPHPFSLHSFIEFLSQNDQLGPLEFSLEARRYRRSYFIFQELGGIGKRQYRLQHLSSLWQRLLVNYLTSGSPCEIQLSPQIRYTLMEYSYPGMLPPPEIIGLAVEQVHEAMQQWIFPQYLAYRASFPEQVTV